MVNSYVDPERDARALRLLSEARGAGFSRRRSLEERVILEYRGVAEALANRYRNTVREVHDLRQVAYLGLVKAVKRFDPEVQSSIVSYAVPTIAGEIKRYLRDASWDIRPPRGLQEFSLELQRVVPELRQNLGREPSPRDIAASTGRTVREVTEGLAVSHLRRVATTELTAGEQRDGYSSPSHLFAADEEGFRRVELSLLLTQVMRDLSATDRRVISMRFFDDMTQAQIAKELQVSQVQVSRMLERICANLRAALDSDTSRQVAS